MRQSFILVDDNIFVKMEKIEYRDVIKYLHLISNKYAQIKAKFDAAYGDSAPSFAAVPI